jgi:hypothetical protein
MNSVPDLSATDATLFDELLALIDAELASQAN